jgi:hypothetical protein
MFLSLAIPCKARSLRLHSNPFVTNETTSSRPHGCSKVAMPIALGSSPLNTLVASKLSIVDDIVPSNSVHFAQSRGYVEAIDGWGQLPTRSTGYVNALSVRRHQHHVALYLWNMSPSSGPLLGPDYACIPNLYICCLAFQDHPTFYSNLDVSFINRAGAVGTETCPW